MNASASYRLGEVGGFKDDPRYDIPPLEYRNGLGLGAQARLMVEFPDRAAPVWVQVRKVLGPGWYLGRAQDGAEVEFGSEHIFTVRGPEMGASSWLEFLPGGSRRARPGPQGQPPPPPPPPPRGQAQTPEAADPRWFEFLPGASRSQKRPSLFDFWKKTAPVDPVDPQAPQPKRSFWDWLRRKPQVTVEPIPPAERRDRPTTIHLPYGAPSRPRPEPEEPKEFPPEPPPAAQEPAQASPQAIIVPEAFRGGVVAQEGGSELPDDLFQVLAPEPPPSGGGLIVAREEPEAPARAPQGLVVAPREESLPAQVDAFSVLAPAPPEAFGPPAAAPAFDPFSVIAPAPAEPFGPPAQVGPADPFTMFQPDPAGSFGPPGMAQPLTPFDVLGPAAEPPGQGMVVAGDVGASAFDILDPQGGMVQAPAEPPPSVFDALKPEPPPVKKSGRKKKGKEFFELEGMKVPVWNVPPREEWIKWLTETFNVNDRGKKEGLWSYLRKERQNPEFIEDMVNQDVGGEPALIAIEAMWNDSWDFDSIFLFFNVPADIWEPYADAMKKEEEESGYTDIAWEAMQTQIYHPLEQAINEAFDAIKPKDLPGDLTLTYDDKWGMYGLYYWENLPPKEAARLRKEFEAKRKQEELDQQRKQQELIDAEKYRKAQIKKIWGAMPQIKDVIPWIESTYDVDAMFKQIQKWRRSKGWRQAIKSEGEITEYLEQIVDLGPKRIREIEYAVASHFGIPPDIVSLYEDADSNQRIWEEIFWPFFEVLGDAFTELLNDAGIPGKISIDEDQDDHLVLAYTEQEEDE